MRRLYVLAVFCSASLFAAPKPLTLEPRTATLRSEAVVIGKVTKIESEAVELNITGRKRVASVAVVEISENIFGARGLTHVRVAFGYPHDFVPVPVLLEKDQSGCFFLTKESDRLFTMPQACGPILGDGETQKKHISEVRAAAVVFTDPVKALSVDDKAQRCKNLELILATGPNRGRPSKEETVPMGKAEVRKIIEVALTLPWSKMDDASGGVVLDRLVGYFAPADNGFEAPPKSTTPEKYAAYGEAFKKWLGEKGENLKLKKFDR